jgi:plastocyanin
MKAIFAVFSLATAAAACGGGSGTPSDNTPPAQVGTIRGNVNAAGAPVAAASLTLTRTGAPPRNATSNAAGDYQFADVAVGAWTVGVTPPTGFTITGAASVNVTVAASQVATANFQLQAVPPQAGVTEVVMQDNLFSPNAVTIQANTTVRWRNTGAMEHNSTGANGAWTSPNLAPGATFERLFTQAGTYNYSCTLHAGMTGTITVQ